MKDYYEILGVSKGAAPKSIEEQYKRLKLTGMTDEIKEAYYEIKVDTMNKELEDLSEVFYKTKKTRKKYGIILWIAIIFSIIAIIMIYRFRQSSIDYSEELFLSEEINNELNERIITLDNQIEKQQQELDVRDEQIITLDNQIEKQQQELERRDKEKIEWSRYIKPEEVIGEWITVNRIDSLAEFDILSSDTDYMEEKFGDSTYMKSLSITSDTAILHWSNGFDKYYPWMDDNIRLYGFSSGEFMIKEMNNENYLFLEHKNGDYRTGGDINYYVYKKIK